MTAHTVTARKPFQCQDYPSCSHVIQPGEEYARHVAFPDGDINTADRPWVLRICRGCHTRYGRPMPPRRSKRQGGTS